MRHRVLGLAIVFFALSFTALAADQPPPMPPQELPAGAEVLTRGPVNEAFAEPVALETQEGFVAPSEPPPSIEEVPPARRPQGDRYTWVPGYWSWDGDRNGYIWVSACWRVAPPDMYWVPGYWTRVHRGWEWIPGFWAPVGSQEMEYLPAAPAPMDIMAPGPAPYDDHVWVPGCWYWNQGRYMRRAGYWLREQPGWVWVPSHYRRTPRGYVFIHGYWDYAFDDRGVLFAPVYFPHSVYGRVGFSFSPSIIIDLGVLRINLFTYPRYNHYYFGDYYDDAYIRIGIYPQFHCDRVHTWYDPIYQYDRWQNRRTDPRWDEHRRQDYDRRRADRTLRPPRTYREMESRVRSMPVAQRKNIEVARPISRDVVARQPSPVRYEQINTETRQDVARQGTEVRKYRDERVKWERPAPSTAPAPARTPPAAPAPAPPTTTRPGAEPVRAAPREVRPNQSERVSIPASPVVGKPAAQAGGAQKARPAAPDNERKYQEGQPRGQQKDKKK